MARQQVERLDFADRSRKPNLRMDEEAGSCFGPGLYFRFYESCQRMAATIARTAADVIRPPDQFFGSYATAASFTPADLRFAWLGVMAGIAALAALLLLGWSQIGAAPVSATERRADASSGVAAAPRVETHAERMEAIRRRGLELLRADFPEDEPSPPLPRGDRLELHDAAMKPVMRIATAGEGDGSLAVPTPLPAPPAVSEPAEAKEKHAVKERPAHRRHARHASRHHRDRVRMAHAKYVQVAGEPEVTSTGALQPDPAPPEENKAVSWFKRLLANGNGGGTSSCSPSVNPVVICPREAHAGSQ